MSAVTDARPETSDGDARPTPVARVLDLVARLRRTLTTSDVGALAVLTASTFHLVARDGARNPSEALSALVVVLFGTIVLLPTLRRVSRSFAIVLATLAIAPLVTVATAEIRAGMARPLVASALVPAVALATIHLWRRPWGPRAIGAILALAALRSWYGTFLAWWGGSTGRPTWLALSWHNQSGTLMGCLGVAAAAVGVLLRGRSANLLLALAGLCFGGAWLSGSRGAVVATLLGSTVVAIGVARAGVPWRRLGVAVGILAVVTVGSVGALEAMVGSDGGQPLTSRDQSASGNLIARFGHWEAAVGMAAARPLTGYGPGSYRWASLEHYPLDTNLTASAHNEYIEVLGESGIIGAAPVWVATLAVGWLALAVMWRRRPTGTDERLEPAAGQVDDPLDLGPSELRLGASERDAGLLAAAGAATVLGLHAAIDFDWDYPLLLVLLTIAGSVLWAGRARSATTSTTPAAVPSAAESANPSSSQRLVTAAASVAVIAGLLGGVVVASIRTNQQPWSLDARLSAALEAVGAGDIPAAHEELAQARTWNPGSSSLPVVAAVVDHHAGSLSDAELAEVVGPDHPSSSDRLLVAGRLLEVGATTEAERTLDELAVTLETRRSWGGRQPATMVAGLQLVAAGQDGGCDAASALVPTVVGWAETFGADPADVTQVFDARAPTGCEF